MMIFEFFKQLVNKSGQSSYVSANVFATSMPKNQAVSLTLALCDEILGDKGAYRVHGGGFAGTVQAFVPLDMLDEFKTKLRTCWVKICATFFQFVLSADMNLNN